MDVHHSSPSKEYRLLRPGSVKDVPVMVANDAGCNIANFVNINSSDRAQPARDTTRLPPKIIMQSDDADLQSFTEHPGVQDSVPEYEQERTNEKKYHGWPLFGQVTIQPDERELLTYFRDRVVPFLDIYDQSQTFRHHVIRLALDSPCNLDTMLRISAELLGLRGFIQRRDIGLVLLQAVTTSPSEPKSPALALRLMASFVLGKVLLFAEAVPDEWQCSFHGFGASTDFDPPEFAEVTQRRMWKAFVLLISRLEVAHCLMNSQPLLHEDANDESQMILKASIHCIELLAEVMCFCHSTTETENSTAPAEFASWSSTGASSVPAWERLLRELNSWKHDYETLMRPIIDVDGQKESFPTIIFTSGAGISLSALYHTAMYLLLGSQPQYSPLSVFQEQSQLISADSRSFWHGRRICGIALNSNPEHSNCWDPCLIAAFWYAARRMTRVSQQYDVVRCLERVKKVGWKVDRLIQRLRDEWSQVVGPSC
ncbi:hypothetical protein S40285_10705 [Stachybotrys chlorohalonatus IBT 40285]|uniref:Transcription factor domain-containing protein n=1 Tax=Stachybotrys chlorohalonatus (strain IBT 40285) TaxID=1283841 RepID=A0A084QA46_STAC4|nr:hypothetical protein S40285_10705 [Stachybotrys chlorohalonata IBT 40285]